MRVSSRCSGRTFRSRRSSGASPWLLPEDGPRTSRCLLTVAALKGAFEGRVDEAVNEVNAPLVAAERGIEVSEQRSATAHHYTNLVRVAVTTDEEDVEVAG